MNIKEFTEKARNEIAEILGKEVQVKEVDKTNGVKLYGLMILEPDGNVAPTIYLDHLYDRYLDSEDWSETIGCIITAYQSSSFPKRLDMEWFKDFAKVQGLIFHKLINFEASTALLEKVPYTRYLDFAIVYCVHYENAETGSYSILIHNSHLAMWRCTTQDLARIAEENTPRLFPLKVSTMGEVLQDCMGDMGDCPINEKAISAVPMHVMSNEPRVNGAVTICYKDSLKNFAQKFDSDVVILPSSVHEAILLPLEDNTNFDELKDMVHHVNHYQLDREEFLSDNIYLYRRDTDTVEIV